MHHSDLHQLRQHLKLTQEQMAEELGLSRRAYIDVETGKATYRKLHMLAAERVALAHASLGDPTIAPFSVREEAERLIDLSRGEITAADVRTAIAIDKVAKSLGARKADLKTNKKPA